MSARTPVIAIGLDATAPDVLLRWIDDGHLPNCAALRAAGAFAVVDNVRYYRTETSWLTFLTGALPSETGEWGHVDYDAATYVVRERDAYAFASRAPFYAKMPGRRVCVFDVPLARPVDGVAGVQMMGWGTEVNQCLRVSRPASLMDEIIARHGDHPLFQADAARLADGDAPKVLSYRIPSSYDAAGMHALADRLCVGAERRGEIIRDLLARDRWDLFLGVFSETHTASHLLWHFGRSHPLRERLAPSERDDPMLRVFQAVDRALGRVIAAVGPDADVVLFSIYGIGANVLDVPSMAVLPEALFRWSFPGSSALACAHAAGPLPPPQVNYLAHWKDEMWALVRDAAKGELESPHEQERRGDPLAWQPANWYRPSWPRMKAFALPTYSEGLVRINVTGREANGAVAAGDFRRACDDVCALLRGLVDARTGAAMVRDVVRMRDEAFVADAGPPADLVVLWQEGSPTDVVDSRHVGRIGPLPYFRTGGHSSQGFVLARGARFERGSTLDGVRAERLSQLVGDLVGPARDAAAQQAKR